MERLPKRFEEEVLEPARIYWLDHNDYTYLYMKNGELKYDRDADDYEIAARGLEALKREMFYLEGHWHIQGNGLSDDVLFVDKDFCECVLQAIREVYK